MCKKLVLAQFLGKKQNVSKNEKVNHVESVLLHPLKVVNRLKSAK